jgi:hypothetical protein
MFSTDVEAEKRMAICKACDRLDGNKCLECGCWMPAKTRIEYAKCPLGKWGKEWKAPWEK